MQIDFLPLWINEPQISAYQIWEVTSLRARVCAKRSDSLSRSVKQPNMSEPKLSFLIR